MNKEGLVLIAQAMWKARNEAKVIDALSSYLMTIEYVQYESEASALVKQLYSKGYVIAPRTPTTKDIGEILPELRKYKDHPVVDAVREKLRQLYEASLILAGGDFGEFGFRSIIFELLNNQRPNGPALEALDIRNLEQEAKIIETDLSAAGYQIAPLKPTPSLLDRMIEQTVKGSPIAIIFGEDPPRISAMYSTMLEHERI
jgi:predicted CoA-binding protein